jgi:hypothetical protein
MPDAVHYFTRKIGEYMRDRMKTELESSLSLKACHYGDLDPFPTESEIISEIVPGIFIKPLNGRSDFATLNQRYHVYYRYRVFWVARLEEGVTVEHIRAKLEQIMDVVVSDIELNQSGTLDFGTPAKGEVVWSVVREWEYQAPEENYLVQAEARLLASAFNWEVRTLMFK